MSILLKQIDKEFDVLAKDLWYKYVDKHLLDLTVDVFCSFCLYNRCFVCKYDCEKHQFSILSSSEKNLNIVMYRYMLDERYKRLFYKSLELVASFMARNILTMAKGDTI